MENISGDDAAVENDRGDCFPLVLNEYVKLPSFTNIYSYSRVGARLLVATEKDVHAVRFACQQQQTRASSNVSVRGACEALNLFPRQGLEDVSVISMHAMQHTTTAGAELDENDKDSHGKDEECLPVVGVTVRNNATGGFVLAAFGCSGVADWHALRDDCVTTELDFTPYVLTSSILLTQRSSSSSSSSSSSNACLLEFLLSGSDREIHRYGVLKDTGELTLVGCIEQVHKFNLKSAVLSLDVFRSVAPTHNNNPNGSDEEQDTWVALGCQDGTVGLLNLDEVDREEAKRSISPSAASGVVPAVVSTSSKIGSQVQALDGPGVCMLFFRHCVPQSTTCFSSSSSSSSFSKELDVNDNAALYHRAHQRFQGKTDTIYSAQVPDVHLAIGSAMGYGTIVRHVTFAGLELDCLLPESDRYDSVLCMYAADLDMDGVNEIVVGTYSQRILIYKLTPFGHGLDAKHREKEAEQEEKEEVKRSRVNETHNSFGQNYYQLVHVIPTTGPVYAVDAFDVACDGLVGLVVVTMYSVELYQWDFASAMAKLQRKMKLCDEIRALETALQKMSS